MNRLEMVSNHVTSGITLKSGTNVNAAELAGVWQIVWRCGNKTKGAEAPFVWQNRGPMPGTGWQDRLELVEDLIDPEAF